MTKLISLFVSVFILCTAPVFAQSSSQIPEKPVKIEAVVVKPVEIFSPEMQKIFNQKWLESKHSVGDQSATDKKIDELRKAKRGHEGSGGGNFTRSDFYEIGFEALELIEASSVISVAGYQIIHEILWELLYLSNVIVVDKPIIEGKQNGVHAAYTYKDLTIKIYSKDFKGKSRSKIRQLILHEIMRLARINDDNNFVSLELNRICEDVLAHRQSLKGEVNKNVNCDHYNFESRFYVGCVDIPGDKSYLDRASK